MELNEKVLSSERLFQGVILGLRRDTVQLPNGKTAFREVAEHPGGVAIVALTEEGEVMLVRQYRYPFGRKMLEIPAGKREVGEPPFVTAQRELMEEVGAKAEKWYDLGTMLPSPGCYNEVVYIYMAEGLRFSAPCPDEDEFLAIEKMPLTDLVALCLSGEVADAKTVVGTLKAHAFLAAGKKPCALDADGV